MFKKFMAFLLSMVLLFSLAGTAFAADSGGSFVLAAMNANSTIISPVRVSYQSGQTIKQALANSGYSFVGLEQGFIYEIEGVSANFSLFYDGGAYELDVPASNATALVIGVTSVYSESVLTLVKRMAEYSEMTNHVQNYPAAKEAYEAALKGIRSADSQTADALKAQLDAAITEYEGLQSGTKYTVGFSATQNGSPVSNPVVMLIDAFGNETTVTGTSVQVVKGEYRFSISDGAANRTEGTVRVDGNTSVSVTLPHGAWFGDVKLQNGEREPFRSAQDQAGFAARYWIDDTAGEYSSVYLYVGMGDVPDPKTTRLRTIYTGVNGIDYAEITRSWESNYTALVNLLQPGMEGRSFQLEAQYEDPSGHTEIQSYDIAITRVPTLKNLTVTAEGTTLPLEFDPATRSYDLTTVSSSLKVRAEAFDAGYTVSGSGTVSVSDGTKKQTVTVKAPNGESSSYMLNITKVASVPVTVSVPSGTTVEVLNAAGSAIAPVNGVYKLVPGETYTCIATKNTWYHSKVAFTAAQNLTVSVAAPKTTDLLQDLALYNTSSKTTRRLYECSTSFSPANHVYDYEVSDCNSSVYAQATLSGGSATANYAAQSTVATSYGLAKSVGVTYAVSSSGGANALSYAVAKSGYGQTVTLRISSTENGVEFYQDYTLNLNRKLHLTNLSFATQEEALTFLNAQGSSVAYDRDVVDYAVRVDRDSEKLLITGEFPNTSDTTPCCGGYYAKVNGVRYDDLSDIEVALNPSLDREQVQVEVCHEDTGSIATTYSVEVQKTDPIQVTVKTNPGNAVVFMTSNLNGKRIPDENGVYTLTPGGSYSYVVTCAGFVGQKVTDYTAPDANGTLNISLNKAPAATLPSYSAAWPHLRLDNNNNGVINYRTPINAEDTVLYWATKIGDGYDSNACGCPILVNGYLYTYSGSTLYMVDTATGEIVKTAAMDHSSSFAINPPTYANGMIFVGLADGTVQAFNAQTLESLWIYRDAIGGQPNCSIVYHDGYVYTGFWIGETNEANFVCLNATDEDPSQPKEEKLPTWYYTSKGGFYWAGAYVSDDYLLVGTDDGDSGYTSGKPRLLSLDTRTGKLLDSYQMSVTGDIRSSITQYNGKFYFTSKGGYFFEASVNEIGEIQSVRTMKLYNYANDPSNPAMSTCTPTIYNGRAYIGVSGVGQFKPYSGHNITVIDIPNWEIAYTVRTQGYPQTSGVLTTAYAAETGSVYVYFFDNFTPGKLRVLKDKPGQTGPAISTMEIDSSINKSYETPYNLFTPSGDQAQYAICSPIMDENGTIYFKNDSAYLMAVGCAIDRLEITKEPDKTTYKAGDVFDGTGMQVTAYFTNGLSKDVTSLVTWSQEPLTEDDTDFQITYPYVMYQNKESGSTMESGVDYIEPVIVLSLSFGDNIRYGDINGDEEVDITDIQLICRYILGSQQLTEAQVASADVSGDGEVDITDIQFVARYILGSVSIFPAETATNS